MEIILHVVKEIGGKKSVTALLYMSNYVRTMPLNYNYVGENICLWAIIMWGKTYMPLGYNYVGKNICLWASYNYVFKPGPMYCTYSINRSRKSY